MEYSKLLERVLVRFPELSREEVEAMVEAKMRESKLLNKVGALLLVAEELGAFKESGAEKPESGDLKTYTKIEKLVPGLRDVSVRGVVYALAGPIDVRDHRIMRMKLGDDSGGINITIWDEKADEAAELKLQLGDQVAILHAYTRERIETGRPELHIGRNGMIVKLEPEPGAPDPKSFYVDLGEALISGDGVYDVKAMVLDPGKERTIDTRYGEAAVREIRLIGEAGEARLTIWRDRVEEFGDLEPGETIYITDVRVEGYRLALTPRSILALREKPSEETLKKIGEKKVKGLVVRVLDVIETPSAAIYISTDGEHILRVHVPEKLDVKPGDHLEIKEAIRETRRGKTRIICGEGGAEKASEFEEIRPPDRMVKLRDVASKEKVDLADVIVEGTLYTKTQLTKLRTRFGEAEKIGFWLKDEDAAVQGSAWRSKAREIYEIQEGTRIRLKWVNIRMNVFNEPEIQLDNESIIEIIEEPKKQGSINS